MMSWMNIHERPVSGYRLWIGCGNYEEYPDGFLCFIEPSKPFVRKWFRKIDTTDRLSALGHGGTTFSKRSEGAGAGIAETAWGASSCVE